MSAPATTRATRFDLARLDATEELPDGSLRVPARVAKVGVLQYQDGEGNTWGELVPESTLFDPRSMQTLRGAAVVDLHPSRVTAENRRELQRGHVGDDVRKDGLYLTAGAVYVTDAAEVALVKRGERKDVSCAYDCDLEESEGVFDGVPYARIQRQRVYNHLGLGPEGWGRAGTDVALKVDGKEHSGCALRLDAGAAVARLDAREPLRGADKTPDTNTRGGSSAPATEPAKGAEKHMLKVTKKDGDEMPPKDPEKDKKDADEEMVPKKDADAMVAEQVAKIAALDALVNALSKQLAELKATMASEESAEVTEADVPEAVADSIVAKRLAKLVSATTDAKLVAPTVKLDGLVSTRKVHEAALSLVVPEMKFDGLTDDRVAGMFDALAATAKKAAEKGAEKGEKRQDGKSVRNDALGAAHRAAAGEPGERPADTVEDAIRKMHQDSCDDWKRATPALRVPTTIKAD